MAPLVALVAAGARQRLLEALDGEHAERARNAGAQLDLHQTAGALLADVVVVRRLAADDRAERRDARVGARFGAVLRGQRQLERARDLEDVDTVGAALLE